MDITKIGIRIHIFQGLKDAPELGGVIGHEIDFSSWIRSVT